jgi:hypothetical protein
VPLKRRNDMPIITEMTATPEPEDIDLSLPVEEVPTPEEDALCAFEDEVDRERTLARRRPHWGHRDEDDVKDTAWHEAAHAVIAAHLHIPFHYATCEEVGDSYGHVKMMFPQDWVCSRLFLERDAIVALSPAADDEDGRWLGWKGDEENVKAIAKKMGVPESDFAEWRLALFAKAARLVRRDDIRRAIRGVANQLMRTPRVSARRVKQILARSRDAARR